MFLGCGFTRNIALKDVQTWLGTAKDWWNLSVQDTYRWVNCNSEAAKRTENIRTRIVLDDVQLALESFTQIWLDIGASAQIFDLMDLEI